MIENNDGIASFLAGFSWNFFIGIGANKDEHTGDSRMQVRFAD